MSPSTDGEPTEQVAQAGTDFLSGFISEEEYAHRRGITVRTCQRDRQLRKSPPFVRVGRRIYYRLDAVRQWLIGLERDHALGPDPLRARSEIRRKNQESRQRSRDRGSRAPSTTA